MTVQQPMNGSGDVISLTHDFTPESRQAFHDLLDTLREAIELTSNTAGDENDSAEGYRWLTQFLRSGLEQFFENDPDRPRFVPLIMPKMARPWAAHSAPMDIWSANPHTIYDWAPLAPGRSYRITGTRGTAPYLGVALYSGTEWNGLMPSRIGDSLNMTNIVFEADGSFEIEIGPSRPDTAPNFLEADPDAHSVLIRQFFADPETDEPSRYMIEAIDQPGPAPRLTDHTTAHRLRSVTTFLRETGTDFLKAFGRPAPVLPSVPNCFDLASLNDHKSETGRAVRGGTGFMYINPDHWYLFCSFQLQADEALVVDLTPPQRCHWWGLYAHDRYMQPFDYSNGGHNLVSIGNVALASNGTARIVVSAQDLGAPNWINTSGRREGTLTLRWTITGIDPEQKPEVPIPSTRLVRSEEVPALLRAGSSNELS